jgi:hypothetical protein
MKYVRLFITDTWRLAAAVAAGLLVAASVFIYKLGSLVPGLDAYEAKIHQAITTHGYDILEILRQGINLPYNIGLFLLQYQPFHGAGSLRFLSVIIALTAAVSLFYILYTWHTSRLAILGTTLFVTASWQLHVARYGGPLCLYLLPLILLACWTWLQSRRFIRPAMVATTVTACMCLYVPGLIWFLVPVIIMRRGRLKQSFRYVPLETMLLSQVIAIVLVIPLVLSFAWPADNTTVLHNLLQFLGLPSTLPNIGSFIEHLLAVPRYLFYQLGNMPALGIRNVPLLDVFTAGMFILGSFVFLRDIRLDRSKLILLYLLVGWVLIALNGSVTITMLLPVIMLVAAEGIAYLLIEWLTIFPRNPVARSIGVSIITIAVCLTASYNLANYFVAWPHTAEVKSSFNHRL